MSAEPEYVSSLSRILAFTLLLLITACAQAPSFTLNTPSALWNQPTAPAYDYPINNPYASTVIAVPPEMKLDYSDVPLPEEKTLTIFPDREIPEGFWYERGLRYSEMLQKAPAPLVYVIAGTGADHRAEKMHTIGNILYSAGFSVVLLPSATHQNFIINASSNYVVGRPEQSAQDLYRVIQQIDHDITQHTTVTQRMLSGYSLGALDAAFTAKLDDAQHRMNFSRVLLINPPLSAHSSIKTISAMIYKGLPNGMDDADGFIKTMLLRLRTIQQSGDALDFSNERLLLEAYQHYKIGDATLAATIGLSFRLSAASMAFTADVMSKSGYVFPKDRAFTTSTDLTQSMGLALRTSFVDYFNQYYVQRMHQLYPHMTTNEMVDETSLIHLNGYIQHNPKFGLITNADDVILAPGEVDTLANLFSPNAVVFENGGHVGNLAHPAVGYAIVHFMRYGRP